MQQQHPDFFESLVKLQSRRLEDQRCYMPQSYPQVELYKTPMCVYIYYNLIYTG